MLHKLNKGDISELRSYKNPPSAVRLVGEAMCYYFNKSATWENFTKLIADMGFIEKIKFYDVNGVSEYAVKSLKKYIDDPAFNVENVRKFSSASALICGWIISLYSYSVFNINVCYKNLIIYLSSIILAKYLKKKTEFEFIFSYIFKFKRFHCWQCILWFCLAIFL